MLLRQRGCGVAEVRGWETHRSICPHLFRIINLKLTIRRTPLRLYGRQIRAYHLRHGVFIRHIDRPYPRPCANIEDLVRFRDWRKMQLPVEDVQEDLVVQVQPVLLEFVRRHRVLIFSEVSVVAAACRFSGDGEEWGEGRPLEMMNAHTLEVRLCVLVS